MPSRKTATIEREWCGPAAQTLKAIYNCRSPEPLYIERARELVNSSRITGPPFDPFQYAKYLQIHVEEQETMELDGTLTQNEQGQFVIRLKKFIHPPSRKNFTLAHEIAHTFFYEDLRRSRGECGQVNFDKEEEKLCNKAAAELLMPFSPFKSSLLRGGDVTPETILGLIQEYQVTLQAASIRTWEVTGSFALTLWKQEGHSINLEWVTPKDKRGLILCQTGKSSIETALTDPGKVIEKRDSFYQLGPDGSNLIKKVTSSFRLFPSNVVLSVITLNNNF